MAKRKGAARLSAGEMEIMQIVWKHRSVTIAEAHRAMRRPIQYPTVQTRLNRLVEKGVLSKSSQRPARYRAVVAPEEVSAGHLELLLQRVSGGSILPLVAHLLRERPLSHEEIEQIKELIAEAERDSDNAAGGNRE